MGANVDVARMAVGERLPFATGLGADAVVNCGRGRGAVLAAGFCAVFAAGFAATLAAFLPTGLAGALAVLLPGLALPD